MLTIRNAVIEDAQCILDFITKLAIFEKAPLEVSATLSDIKRTLFAKDAAVYCLIAELNNKAIGFAVYFFNYSTWQGKHGIYLEDLFISPEYRQQGFAHQLLKHIAQIARDNDCARFEWSVLDWNTPAIKLYQKMGAKPKDEWITYRLEKNGIARLADQKHDASKKS